MRSASWAISWRERACTIDGSYTQVRARPWFFDQ